jgi:hypothetical protein
MTETRREEKHVDRMSEQSFPASDPPSTTPPPGTRRAERHEADAGGAGAAGEAKPKGHPTDDRYHQETAAARQHGVHPPERDKRTGPR